MSGTLNRTKGDDFQVPQSMGSDPLSESSIGLPSASPKGPISRRETTDIEKLRTRQDLVIHLHTVLSSRLPPSLLEVVNLHSARPHLKSIRSYNIVLAYAYRVSDFRTARKLLAEMRDERFSENMIGNPSATSEIHSTDRSGVDPEQEFREVIYRGIWTRGGAGRRKGTRAQTVMDSAEGQADADPGSSEAVDITQSASEPTAPPERPFPRGSMMDVVYRSVRMQDPSRESNETLKRILLGSRVEPQLGVRRKASRHQGTATLAAPTGESKVSSRVLRSDYAPSPATDQTAQIDSWENTNSAATSNLTRSSLAITSPGGRRPAGSVPILPWSTALALLGSASVSATPELFLAYIKYILNSSLSSRALPLARCKTDPRSMDSSDGTKENGLDRFKHFNEVPPITVALEELLKLHAQRPDTKNSQLQGYLQRLLDLYLHPHLARHYPPHRTIEAFQIALNARGQPFQPTARTLTYALYALRNQRARNLRALHLVDMFISKWGEASVGVVSWRLLGKYGHQRRCADTVKRAKAGLWQWSAEYRANRARARSQRRYDKLDTQHNSSGELATHRASEVVAMPASQTRWKLPYIRKNLSKWRRMIRKMRQAEHPSRTRRRANRDLIARPRKKRSIGKPTGGVGLCA
jgi:hypothetical protein